MSLFIAYYYTDDVCTVFAKITPGKTGARTPAPRVLGCEWTRVGGEADEHGNATSFRRDVNCRPKCSGCLHGELLGVGH